MLNRDLADESCEIIPAFNPNYKKTNVCVYYCFLIKRKYRKVISFEDEINE